MDVSIATIKLLYLGIHGVIAYLVSDKMVIRKNGDISRIFITVFIYSIIIYAFLSVLLSYFGADINYVYKAIIAADFQAMSCQYCWPDLRWVY